MPSILAPIVASLLFAGSFAAARFVTLEMDPLTATLLRYIAALIFLTILWASGSHSLRVSPREVPKFLLLGLTGIAGYHYFFFLSLRHTDVVNTAIINGLNPLVAGVMAAVIIRERLTFRNYFGVGLAVAGVMVLLTDGRLQELALSSLNRGDLLMLLAVVSWGAYAVLVRTMAAKYSVFCLTYYTAVGGVLLLSALSLHERPVRQLAAATPTALWSLLYMGVAASGVGYLLYNSGVRQLGPTKTAAVVYGLLPLWVAALGWLFFQEAVVASTVVSIALIVAGLHLTTQATPTPGSWFQGSRGRDRAGGAQP